MADEPEVLETEIDTGPVDVVSHRDDASNDVRAAVAELRGDEPAADPARAETTASERARAPDGKFVAKDAAPVTAAAPAPTKDSAAVEPTKASEQAPSTAPAAPPVSWSPEAKQLWASAPPAIQQAAIKREAEVSEGFRQYGEKVRAYESALAPAIEATRRHGIPVGEGIQRLVAAQDMLDRDPHGGIYKLAQMYGVDLAQLASNPPAHQPALRPDPMFAQVTSQVSALQQQLESLVVDKTLGQVQAFASDPKRPYYADVEDSLPGIMRQLQAADPNLTGTALLEKAYDQAVWLTPAVRDKMLSSAAQEKQQASTASIRQREEGARKAAISVRGSSANSRPAPKALMNGSGSAADDVRAAFEQLRGSM